MSVVGNGGGGTGSLPPTPDGGSHLHPSVFGVFGAGVPALSPFPGPGEAVDIGPTPGSSAQQIPASASEARATRADAMPSAAARLFDSRPCVDSGIVGDAGKHAARSRSGSAGELIPGGSATTTEDLPPSSAKKSLTLSPRLLVGLDFARKPMDDIGLVHKVSATQDIGAQRQFLGPADDDGQVYEVPPFALPPPADLTEGGKVRHRPGTGHFQPPSTR